MSKLSWGGWAGISAIVGIVAVLVSIWASLRQESPAPAAPASVPIPTSASSPTATFEVPTATSSSEATPDAVSYVDDYAKECGVGITTGSASLNGNEYAHTILQWAGDSNDSITISRKAHRFQATVGIRDTESDQVRLQFELQGDNGQELFKSRVLGFGETQPVDVPVDGVLRITLRVKALSRVWGYAGWGDARITSSSKLEC